MQSTVMRLATSSILSAGISWHHFITSLHDRGVQLLSSPKSSGVLSTLVTFSYSVIRSEGVNSYLGYCNDYPLSNNYFLVVVMRCSEEVPE
jgi:hypothetical protein